MKKKEKAPLTYEEEHNKAFFRFEKSAKILFWAGILNFVSFLISILQYISNGSTISFYLSFGFSAFFAHFFANINDGILYDKYIYVLFIIIGVIMALLTLFAVLISLKASKGKKYALFAGLGFYTADTLMIIPTYFLGEEYRSVILMSVLHLAILGIMVFSLIQYYKIIKIAKKHGILKEDK